MDVSVAEWLAWLTSNCGRIGAVGSSYSNGLKEYMWCQKGFNPLCQCVYIYVCIVNPDIKQYIYVFIHQYILARARFPHRVKHVRGGPRGFCSPRISSVHWTSFLWMSRWPNDLRGRLVIAGESGVVDSSPRNGLKPYMWGQKLFNPLCQCVYIYVCIVNPDIQTIHICRHTSIHTSQSQVCPQGQAR